MIANSCPSCGFNLKRDEIVVRDGFEIDPRGTVLWHGKIVPLTPSGSAIFHAVAAQTPGRPISVEALINRVCGEDLEGPGSCIAVQVHRIRSTLRRIGAPQVIETLWGRGFVWKRPT